VAAEFCFDDGPRSRRCSELDLWGRWARGDTVNVQRLGDAAALLTSGGRWGRHADRFRALGEAIRGWADDVGIDLPTATRHSRTLDRAGPELGM
jgi:hypothetical protein